MKLWFIYNGVGYDGIPSRPSDAVFAFDPGNSAWIELAPLSTPSMDHRNLPSTASGFLLIGGMAGQQRVLKSTRRYALGAIDR